MKQLFIYCWNILKLFVKQVRTTSARSRKNRGLPACDFGSILKKNFPPGSPFSFIQVGAYDGVSYDGLFDFVKSRKATGLAIEPLPDAYARLARNYAYNPDIVTVNKAVHASLDKVIIYRVDPARLSGLPEWSAGIGSLDPQHHKRSGIPSDVIVPQPVAAARLMDIVDKTNLPVTLNLLQVDTEGYDFDVLKSFDFNKIIPDLVRIEYVNLPQDAVEAACILLRSKGYFCLIDEDDLIGVRLKRVRI